VIDLHCHVLPGLDDGPRDMEQALDLLRGQQAAGITALTATSHVSHAYPGVTVDSVSDGLLRVRAAASAAGIGVDVHVGGEIALMRGSEMSDEELSAFGLGGGPWLLIEAPHIPVRASMLEFPYASILHRGHKVLIAHPERCAAFHEDREVLERLVAGGACCSITASALSGAFGRTVRQFALELFAEGLVHNIASDAHGGMASRPPGLAEHLAGTGYETLGPWLCEEVPAAILAGEDLPAPPAWPPAPRRGWRARLRRRGGRGSGGRG
jgi:protein-tyrosine phosphatase